MTRRLAVRVPIQGDLFFRWKDTLPDGRVSAMLFKIMTKTNKIIYWISTLWLALGMFSIGIVQIIKLPPEAVANVNRLGYPTYFMTILGVWKILGVVAILVPKYPLVKEWAYAGFFFTMSGAFISHIAVNDPFSEIFPSIFLLILTVVSWYFRPDDRRFARF